MSGIVILFVGLVLFVTISVSVIIFYLVRKRNSITESSKHLADNPLYCDDKIQIYKNYLQQINLDTSTPEDIHSFCDSGNKLYKLKTEENKDCINDTSDPLSDDKFKYICCYGSNDIKECNRSQCSTSKNIFNKNEPILVDVVAMSSSPEIYDASEKTCLSGYNLIENCNDNSPYSSSKFKQVCCEDNVCNIESWNCSKNKTFVHKTLYEKQHSVLNEQNKEEIIKGCKAGFDIQKSNCKVDNMHPYQYEDFRNVCCMGNKCDMEAVQCFFDKDKFINTPTPPSEYSILTNPELVKNYCNIGVKNALNNCYPQGITGQSNPINSQIFRNLCCDNSTDINKCFTGGHPCVLSKTTFSSIDFSDPTDSSGKTSDAATTQSEIDILLPILDNYCSSGKVLNDNNCSFTPLNDDKFVKYCCNNNKLNCNYKPDCNKSVLEFDMMEDSLINQSSTDIEKFCEMGINLYSETCGLRNPLSSSTFNTLCCSGSPLTIDKCGINVSQCNKKLKELQDMNTHLVPILHQELTTLDIDKINTIRTNQTYIKNYCNTLKSARDLGCNVSNQNSFESYCPAVENCNLLDIQDFYNINKSLLSKQYDGVDIYTQSLDICNSGNNIITNCPSTSSIINNDDVYNKTCPITQQCFNDISTFNTQNDKFMSDIYIPGLLENSQFLSSATMVEQTCNSLNKAITSCSGSNQYYTNQLNNNTIKNYCSADYIKCLNSTDINNVSIKANVDTFTTDIYERPLTYGFYTNKDNYDANISVSLKYKSLTTDDINILNNYCNCIKDTDTNYRKTRLKPLCPIFKCNNIKDTNAFYESVKNANLNSQNLESVNNMCSKGKTLVQICPLFNKAVNENEIYKNLCGKQECLNILTGIQSYWLTKLKDTYDYVTSNNKINTYGFIHGTDFYDIQRNVAFAKLLVDGHNDYVKYCQLSLSLQDNCIDHTDTLYKVVDSYCPILNYDMTNSVNFYNQLSYILEKIKLGASTLLTYNHYFTLCDFGIKFKSDCPLLEPVITSNYSNNCPLTYNCLVKLNDYNSSDNQYTQNPNNETFSGACTSALQVSQACSTSNSKYSTIKDIYTNTCPKTKIDCAVSDWITIDCTKPCGGGTQYNYRNIITYPVNEGSVCPILKTDSVNCNTQPCIPVDCVVSDWSQCNVSCGGGIQNRSIITQPKYGGTECPSLIQSCNTQLCPVNCVVSEWGTFSDCLNGSQTRSRTIITQPSNGGQLCPALTETLNCTTTCTTPCCGKVPCTDVYNTCILCPNTNIIGTWCDSNKYNCIDISSNIAGNYTLIKYSPLNPSVKYTYNSTYTTDNTIFKQDSPTRTYYYKNNLEEYDYSNNLLRIYYK